MNKGADVDWDVSLLRTSLKNYICAFEKSDKRLLEYSGNRQKDSGRQLNTHRNFEAGNKIVKQSSNQRYGNFRNGVTDSRFVLQKQ